MRRHADASRRRFRVSSMICSSINGILFALRRVRLSGEMGDPGVPVCGESMDAHWALQVSTGGRSGIWG